MLLAKLMIISQMAIFLLAFFVKNSVFLSFNKLYGRIVNKIAHFYVISHDKC